MKEIKSIDRSFQNHKNEVNETDVPKSGQNLSYRNHLGGLVLGRLYPQSFQHLMPNDKISGSNEASMTFEQLSTPVIDDVDVCVHNFLVTLRSIDNRFEKFMTPTKLNNMNKNVSVPTYDLGYIIAGLFVWLDSLIYIDSDSKIHVNFVSLESFNAWDYVYHSDAVHDLYSQLLKYYSGGVGVIDPADDDARITFALFLTDIFMFFVGKRSLLDYFGLNCLSSKVVYESFYNWIEPSEVSNYAGSSNSFIRFIYNVAMSTRFLTFWNSYDDSQDIYWGFRTYGSENEYALRAYYAIWFEYYRNYDLEPRSNLLPEYRDFGANSIFGSLESVDIDGFPIQFYNMRNLFYLVPRIRSWQQDAFTTAGIDDISRHVFAPLLDSTFAIANSQDDSLQPSGILDNNTIMQSISWRNPATGVVSNVEVPMPSRLLSALQQPSQTLNTYGVELFSLRKAQMLENYLKRIYYGGDEYRDRMLHLYGARIEDYRINRPQWLSSSIDSISPRQEVANTGVAPGSTEGWSAGSRLATATAVQGGNDGFTEFCPEFGIYISMLSIMPHATYDPYIMPNLQIKYADFPIPQFANQMEDVISTREISRDVAHQAFGYAPYAHAYRYRVDEVHGDYHDNKYDYVFFRFWDAQNVPNLSWSFIHCRPKLPMFVNSTLLDGQVYGTFKHNFLVECPLPSPVETI